MALLLVLLQWLDRWSSVDPDSRWVDYAAPLLGPLVVVAGWAALWALATQLFQHRFPFATHLRKGAAGAVRRGPAGVAAAPGGLCLLVAAPAGAGGLGCARAGWRPGVVACQHRLAARADGWGAVVCCWCWAWACRPLAAGSSSTCSACLASLAPPAFDWPAPPPASLIDSLRPLQAELARQANKDNEAPEADRMILRPA